MKKYSFDNISNIYAVGDYHGEFKKYFHEIKRGLLVKSEDEDKPHPKEIERQERMQAQQADTPLTLLEMQMLRDRQLHSSIFREAKEPKWKKKDSYPYSNSVFIIAGDCGIGFNKPKYYEDLFNKYNKILNYNNTYVIFVRGNHDDPSYFDGEMVNLSNIKAVPDYSVIEANEKHVLCIGGAISVDRQWRKKQEERINRFSPSHKKRLYWENEAPIFNEEALKEIANEVKIDYVVSHSAPSFVPPETHGLLKEWVEDDKELANDVDDERTVFDKIFATLRDLKNKPTYWAYGHFNIYNIERRSDTIFKSLGDGFGTTSISSDIEQFLTAEAMNVAKKKVKRKKKNSSPFDGIDLAINDLDRHNNALDELLELPEFNGVGEAVEREAVEQPVAAAIEPVDAQRIIDAVDNADGRNFYNVRIAQDGNPFRTFANTINTELNYNGGF